MTDQASGVLDTRADYMAQVRRKRMMDGIILVVFIALMVTGFMIADDRNAGGFWDGLHRFFDFPKEVLSEAIEKIGELPANLLKYLPSLIET
ncbi:MAG: phosphonate ABC transporter, permease protein PhnE, partial [Shimia sp.]|nr:phosphonate ABC transporter, permease protein PhnE [Shimia sp.]